MYIARLNVCDTTMAKRLLEIQRESYRVEADLIGLEQIPAMNDTLKTLQASKESFIGGFLRTQDHPNDLVGVLGYARSQNTVQICRLVVHPDHFRRGFGRALLRAALQLEQDAKTFVVSTGSNNGPAVRLYESEGFKEVGRYEVAGGVTLSQFERLRC